MSRYKWISGVLAIVLLANTLWIATARGNEEKVAPSVHTETPAEGVQSNPQSTNAELMSMQKAGENSFLELYFQPETAEVAVKDKRTNALWRSNPIDREQDGIATGPIKGRLGSQITVAFYNEAGLVKEYDNFNDSIESQQFEYETIDNGVKFRFSIGDMSLGIEAVPKRISVERMQSKILDKLADDSVRKDVLKRFRLLEDEGVYERRDNGIQEVHLKRLLAVFDEVGYTVEDLQEDLRLNGLPTDQLQDKALFHVTLEYLLDGENLIVRVPGQEIEGPDNYVLQSLRLLEYFGAANENQQGYMLVPDGSGALIYLNNGKLKTDPYQGNVYGTDNTRDRTEVRQFDEPVRLPVFGMVQNHQAFMSIMEQGEGIGSIEADISGRRHSYNTVYSSYQLVAKDELTLAGNSTTQTSPIFQTSRYSGDIQVRYAFLPDSEANYSGMAAYYRNYLIQKYDLKPLSSGESTPFFLELVGGITVKKSFLGIPYQSMKALTTFDEAQSILNELKKDGIEDIKLRYSGWFNKGVNHKPASKISVDGVVGGSGGLAQLKDYVESNGIELYPDVAFSTIYRKGSGFSPSKEAARFINHSPAKLYPFSRATYAQDKTASPMYVLSPEVLPAYVGDFLKAYQRYDVGGISLRDLGADLNADYHENEVIDREQAKHILTEQLKAISDQTSSVMLSGGNAFALPYANSIVHAPLSSSYFNITDESVPFYSMVLHGYIEFAGEPINMMEDQNVRKSILKLLETGANIYYQWYYAPSYSVKETEFDSLYASHYGDWIDEAKALYQELNPVLKDIGSRTITQHEKLQEGVYKTSYDGGISFIVNYNKSAVTVDGLTIEAESYARRGELK